MSITAAMVKELRQRTGAGMMECKKALVATSGDIEIAIEEMRKSGAAKAAKKSSRIAAEGVVKILPSADGKTATMVEINCETDFVGKDENFLAFTDKVVANAAQLGSESVEQLMATEVNGESLEAIRTTLISKIGENVQVRRIKNMTTTQGVFGHYLHGSSIGVVVNVSTDNADLAKDLAMHVAAIKPEFISEKDVPADIVAKEKEILMAQVADSGKPVEIVEKMIGGRLRKFLAGITLYGQDFVKNPDITVEKLLKSENAEVLAYVRMEVGEGIEKKVDNFAQEVMSQVRGDN
ncbi:Translation elongation factor Ts [hydrothermal vent metagenome]|uniref:Translation elongation factor Ts n=1 Tax=hydrothermal vent metagenome TaxID=652676 RepID=A0A3B0VRH0_9ZZZZ